GRAPLHGWSGGRPAAAVRDLTSFNILSFSHFYLCRPFVFCRIGGTVDDISSPNVFKRQTPYMHQPREWPYCKQYESRQYMRLEPPWRRRNHFRHRTESEDAPEPRADGITIVKI